MGYRVNGPPPDMISAASRVRCRRPRGEVLYEATTDDELASLGRSLRTEPSSGPRGHCDLAKLPRRVCVQLRAHVEATGDAEKIARARAALRVQTDG